MKIGIVVLAHNAPMYCWTTVRSIVRNTETAYELVVVDNASRWPTRLLLFLLHGMGWVDRLVCLPENTFYAMGNNIGVSVCSRDVSHVLLLNSDVKVLRKGWLAALLAGHRPGATALGVVQRPVVRGDGFCLLVDKRLYEERPLDESHRWWWSATRLQAQLLRDGYAVRAIRDHSSLLLHYGGGSGPISRHLTPAEAGHQMSRETIKEWFDGLAVEVVEQI